MKPILQKHILLFCSVCVAFVAQSMEPPLSDAKLLFSFEEGEPLFQGPSCSIVTDHVTHGNRAMLLSRQYAIATTDMDWSGYDFLKADVFVEGEDSVRIIVEVRDKRGGGQYWDRVNYHTSLPSGESTLVVPVELTVGEKSRPGRNIVLDQIEAVAFNIEDLDQKVYLDQIRLEHNPFVTNSFYELRAFDFGTEKSPVMVGMTPVTLDTMYSKEQGYGFSTNASLWRCYRSDVIQPDSLYRDFVNVEAGDFLIDLPNGTYRVFLNVDSAGGYWGELPIFRDRIIKAEGRVVSHDKMDRQIAIEKYFRFANSDDRPEDNVFDKYFSEIFNEKEFEVTVSDGQLNLTFEGPTWANSLSTVIIYPARHAQKGKTYLTALREMRRFEFDNFFHRRLHIDQTETPLPVKSKETLVLFSLPIDQPVYPNTLPTHRITAVNGFGCAEEFEPIPFSIRAYKDLGEVKVTVDHDLTGPSGALPASAIKVGYVSNRLKRQAMDGSTYTLGPRYVMNQSHVLIKQGETRRFWVTVRPPKGTQAGLYKGAISLRINGQIYKTLDLQFDVISQNPLDLLDLPTGGFGWEIPVPWYGEEMVEYNQEMNRKNMELMQQSGLTLFSTELRMVPRGIGTNVTLDFTRADQIMEMAKEHGMKQVVSYGTWSAFGGDIALYRSPTQRFGFPSQREFYHHIFGLVQEHALAKEWLPITLTLCDEPLGAGDTAAAIAASELLKPYQSDQIGFSGFTSVTKTYGLDHQELAEALPDVSYNLHDEWSIGIATNHGGTWSFYNGESRWNFGYYMFMLRQKYDLKHRIAWHWNINAGDPYFALDCREDDYCWVNANAQGELVESMDFQLIREGIDDYRYLLTLHNLVQNHPEHPAATDGQALLNEVLKLQPNRDRRDAVWGEETKEPPFDPQEKRKAIAEVIRALRGESVPKD